MSERELLVDWTPVGEFFRAPDGAGYVKIEYREADGQQQYRVWALPRLLSTEETEAAHDYLRDKYAPGPTEGTQDA